MPSGWNSWYGAAARAAGSDPALAVPGLSAGHLLLEDRGDQRLEDGARPPEANPAMPSIQLRDEWVVPRLEAGSIVVEADQGRQAVERAIGAGPPGLGLEPDAACRDPDRRGAVRRARRPDHGIRAEAHRQVARASQVDPQRGPQIEWAGEVDGAGRHGVSLAGRSDQGRIRRAIGTESHGPEPGCRNAPIPHESWVSPLPRGAVWCGCDAPATFRSLLDVRVFGRSLLRFAGRATPTGCRGPGAHRNARRGRRPRVRRIPGPQPC
jgi:hypothetical protein